MAVCSAGGRGKVEVGWGKFLNFQLHVYQSTNRERLPFLGKTLANIGGSLTFSEKTSRESWDFEIAVGDILVFL